MNVLILSAASKVLLVQAFQQAVGPDGGQVFAADLERDSAALVFADGVVSLPRTDAPGFGEALRAACKSRDIGLVVPTRDAELSVLSALRDRFRAEGVVVLAPDAHALDLCLDKRRFVEVCEKLGLATPKTWAPGETPDAFPVFVRPVSGAGGRGARRIEAADWAPMGPDQLVQAYCRDPEYSIDVLMDLDGRPVQALARRRLQVRAGEAVKSRTEDAPVLTDAALRLCAEIGLVGHNVVQAFWNGQAAPLFIEVNPRFGGASNLSIAAGLASPERLVMMAAGKAQAATAPRALKSGLTMLRYSQDLFVEDHDLQGLGAS
jgi:carbamoyl-phosphate synthase large subunit